MNLFRFKMPDLGEGTVAAAIVAWHGKPGDAVVEGQPIAEASTDKAVVEIPAPVTGRVHALAAEPGAKVAVGAEFCSFDVGNGASSPAGLAAPAAAEPEPAAPPQAAAPGTAARLRASPATRRRAREAGIDLAVVPGTGPGGRILREDLEPLLDDALPDRSVAAPRGETEEIPLLGVRRIIAERMSAAKRTIPHFSYVEEVDVTELEALRGHLAARAAVGVTGGAATGVATGVTGSAAAGAARLTLLPLIVAALARVLEEFPQCNAHYDPAREILIRHRAVHVGIATQTPDGLKVPVVRDVAGRALGDLAAEIRRVVDAARTHRAPPAMLTGSTITVTSLGKLGGIASTPIINAPEVAIIGINRVSARPVVRDGAVAVRQMMNLSSSFDHRFVDGFDAATMIQALKGHLEHPATIFMPV